MPPSSGGSARWRRGAWPSASCSPCSPPTRWASTAGPRSPPAAPRRGPRPPPSSSPSRASRRAASRCPRRPSPAPSPQRARRWRTASRRTRSPSPIPARLSGLADLYAKFLTSDDVLTRVPGRPAADRITASPFLASSGGVVLPVIQLTAEAPSEKGAKELNQQVYKSLSSLIEEQQDKNDIGLRSAHRGQAHRRTGGRADVPAQEDGGDPRALHVPARHRRGLPPARGPAPAGGGARRRARRLGRRAARARRAGRSGGGRGDAGDRSGGRREFEVSGRRRR